ncbi:MAG: alpha/beta hydrolase [Parafilimonas sp.]
MQKTFQYNNATVVYAISGRGTPVVLLHGFGETGSIWNLQVQFLKEHCMLIVPDLPGSGKSAFSNEERETRNEKRDTLEYYVESIYALLKHEGIEECIMLGHSMGGYITLAFAEKYPELLKRFGLINSTAFEDSDEKKSMRKKGIEIIEEYGAYHFLKTTIPNLFADKCKKEYPEKVEQLIEDAKAFSKKALQDYYRAMMNRPDRTHTLKSSKLPVLFVLGTEDNAVVLNDALPQVHLPDISYIHILEKVGHISMWEDAAALNNHLLAFINNESL